MKYIKKYQKILLISMGLVLIFSMFLLLNKSHEYHELPKVKVKEQNNLKQFALMLEQKNGEYQESEGEFPTEGYVFNENKSDCTDLNGKIIDGALNYDYETYTVLVDTSKTSYCYLYYDIEPNIKYLREKDTDSHLTNELAGGLYRYQGLFEKDDAGNVTNDVENYLCLGSDCSEYGEDLYRIIGINAKGELKIIQRTSTKKAKWWSDNTTDIKWPDSDVFHYLNDNGQVSEFYKNETSFLDSLSADAKKYIINHRWQYGDVGYEDDRAQKYNGYIMYEIENGRLESQHTVETDDELGYAVENYTWNTQEDYVDAPIGLMYMHDYDFAYPGGIGTYTTSQNSWIYISNNVSEDTIVTHEIFMTRFGYRSNHYYATVYIRGKNYPSGWPGYLGGVSIDHEYNIRPVFYLSNNINLSGIGTLDDPFKIF